MPRQTLRFTPPFPISLDGYDLDALEVELDGDDVDFRLVLGRGLDIYWALPAGHGDRLRLIHVDSAVSHVDEPSLVADPWCVDVPQLHWPGNRAPIISVTFDALASPPSYQCELVMTGRVTPVRRSWRG